MKYYYIIHKSKINEEIIKEKNRYKLFDDYQKKQEIINQLRQQYLYKEGEKYTFFPIINNYIIKYRNPFFINNVSTTEINNNKNIKNSFLPKYNMTFEKIKYENKYINKNRYNKNQKIKRVKIINHKNPTKIIIIPNEYNYKNNFLIKKRSRSNFRKKIKEEEVNNKTQRKEMTLKTLINEEKMKDKMINKKIKNNISGNNIRKLINTIFDESPRNKTLKRIKTENSLCFTNDESNIFSNKKNINNFKLDSDNSSIFDNINYFLGKNKSNTKSDNKIISIDISKIEKKEDKNIGNTKFYIKNNNNNNYRKLNINEYNKKKQKGIVKLIPIFSNNKLNKNNNKQIHLKKIKLFDKFNKNKNNNNIRYASDFNKTQINNKKIYRNISFEIKRKTKTNNNAIFNQNEYDKKDDDISFQSLSDSKVLEIANTYIDEYVNKNEISEILTHKKLQNQNSS